MNRKILNVRQGMLLLPSSVPLAMEYMRFVSSLYEKRREEKRKKKRIRVRGWNVMGVGLQRIERAFKGGRRTDLQD